MKKTIVCNIVGLTASMITEQTPNLKKLAEEGSISDIEPILPAVTCTVQSTYLTGLMPQDHGVVSNGWYFRELDEVFFWRQSNRLVQGEKLWQSAKKINPHFTCANLFWWYNMASDCDITVTPRPIYQADGIKIPDVYTTPIDLRDRLQNELGQFPLFKFWGPMASIESSQWIMDCYQKVNAQYKADLSLIYIPHLDYPLQRLGTTDPAIESHIKQVDQLLSPLMDEYENSDCHIIILSEYSISNITKPPIQLNRLFRKAGWLVTRNERGGELIDTAQSKVFAVCDHQVAHIYVRDQSMIPVVKSKIQALPLVDAVLDEAGKKAMGLNHDRSGELVAVANRASWFSYYYWLTDDHAPDFAKTVDIHRKPGYDPVELFLDPTLKFPALHIAWRLLKKKLGQRTLMDLIPLDDRLVKGSHGQLSDGVGNPLFISSDNHLLTKNKIQATEVKQLILNHIFQD